MYRLILKRLGFGAITLIAVSLIIFVGTKVLPGDAAQMRLGQEATPQNIAAFREKMGLNLPYWEQYSRWLLNFAWGNLGTSLAGDYPVAQLIHDRYYNTLVVSALTALIGIPISLFLGITSAMFSGGRYDRGVNFFTLVNVASPDFFKATLLVVLVVIWFGSGSAVVIGDARGKSLLELLHHFAFPVATLCLVIASQVIRMTRAAILNEMSLPYIEWAVLKGLSRRRIILRHALPNALGPIVNIIALNLAYLVTSVIVVEIYFAYQGLASLLVEGVQTRDFILVQSVAMLFCAVYVLLMLMADIAAIVSNPRLRHPK